MARNGGHRTMFAAGDRAPVTWRVLGMTSDDTGHMVRLRVGGFWADCGHSHDTRAEAEACPWEPAPPPATYAGIVRQVRDEHAAAQGAMPW